MLRVLKLVKYLPENGWLPLVLTLEKRYSDKVDYTMVREIPKQVRVYRTRMLSPLALYGVPRAKGREHDGVSKDSRPYRLYVPDRLKRGTVLRKARKCALGLLSTPDKFTGWLVPGTCRGLSIVNTRKVDIIFSTSPCPTAHLIGFLIKKITRKPWVADFRDPWTWPREMSKVRRILENWLESRVMKSADKVIATTEHLKNTYAAKYRNFLPGKISVITNGYDSEDFSDIPWAHAYSRSIFTISHIGEFYEIDRRPDNFLIAISELIREGKVNRDRTRINLIGGGEYVRTRGFNDLIERLGLNGVIKIIEHVSHRRSIEYMLRSSVLLLLQPSVRLREEIPGKAFEYIRSGNFVLALAPEGATSDLIAQIPNALVIAPEMTSAIKQSLHGLYVKFNRNQLRPNTDLAKIGKYDRRQLTARLSAILNAVAGQAATLQAMTPRR